LVKVAPGEKGSGKPAFFKRDEKVFRDSEFLKEIELLRDIGNLLESLGSFAADTPSTMTSP
jgi:hypothetical protein